jgi:signal transduction histidine kinase/HAMP domain-containing protein
MVGRSRRSLLVRLLGAYLLFVALVLGTGLAVNLLMQRQLRADVQAADLALAQSIALDIDDKLRSAYESLAELGTLDPVRRDNRAAMEQAFRAFRLARRDIDGVYWLDAGGVLRVSAPVNLRTQNTSFSQRALFRLASEAQGPITQASVIDLTTYNAVAAIARPVRDEAQGLVGVLGLNLRLDDFSASLRAIVDEQARQGRPLQISLVDQEGLLVASPVQERLLQPILAELPGAAEALAGQRATRVAPGPGGRDWLFSAVPVASSGWAVVVQRPAAAALATVSTFNTWLLVVALLFATGGLIYWLDLHRLVLSPLQRLASAYQVIRLDTGRAASPTAGLVERADEVGSLARALNRLEGDVTTRLAELQTLLETSKVVVGTLDPQSVLEAIIHEVRRLVDVQAAAVLVPAEAGGLRVLASQGRSAYYSQAIMMRPNDAVSPATQALREGRPIQLVADGDTPFPPISYAEGFRSLLAIPIVSPHAGEVVLVVDRVQPQPFTAGEITLLMTFANYAALAWEHATLYERSDVRLREEQQTLSAIMRGMSDGLVLAGVDGAVLYTNPGAAILTGLPPAVLAQGTIEAVHAALRAAAARPDAYDQERARAEAGALPAWIVETGGDRPHRAIQLRLFAVRDEADHVIGRGLLLRDVTREQEIDQFKTTLLGAVGHELRTPLAVIKMHASSLLQPDVTWSPDDQRQFVRDIDAEADRLAELVSTLLDMSRIEAGLLRLSREPYRVEDLVGRAAQGMHEPVGRLEVAIPADLPTAALDGPRMVIVLRNLIANALAYGDGLVRISAELSGCSVCIRVADDGPGIPPEELPQLFERFYRAARGQQRRASGIGLGLAICKTFVEAHGGSIWAENGPRGAIFAVLLPLHDPADPAHATGADAQAVARRS